jgi:hopanoid biosynthesis associated protein HpnK
MKQLVITSDDFGLSHGVNRAVEIAWQDGILTSASIMAGGEAFEGALEVARRNPGLQVGLHLTLVQGRSVLPADRIPGLVDHGGNFPDDPVAAGMGYYFDRSLRSQLKREIEAQIVRARDAGIALSHIDGHLNIHLHPTVFSILTELMPRYDIGSIRLSRERLSHNLRFNRERLVGKTVERIIFGSLARHARPALDRMGIRYAGEVKGVLNSGRMTESYILDILQGLGQGLTEIYFHPGCLPDAEITRRMPDYRHQEELAALTSDRVRQKLIDLGIELVSYRGDRKNHA